MGSIRTLDHDADLGLEVTAADLPSLWDLGARALAGVMTDAGAVERRQTVEIEVTSVDLAAAWVDSLAELLLRFEIDGVLLVAVDRLQLDTAAGGEVRARFRARGEPFDPARHPAETGVKAVTHHGACVDRLGDGRWRARVLLDL